MQCRHMYVRVSLVTVPFKYFLHVWLLEEVVQDPSGNGLLQNTENDALEEKSSREQTHNEGSEGMEERPSGGEGKTVLVNTGHE